MKKALSPVPMRAKKAKGEMVDLMNDSNWGGRSGFFGGKIPGAIFAFKKFIGETQGANKDKLPKSKMKKEDFEIFLKKYCYRTKENSSTAILWIYL